MRRHTVLLVICAVLLSACNQLGDQAPQPAHTAPAALAATTTAIPQAATAAPTATPAAVSVTPVRYNAALRQELLRMEEEDQELRRQWAVSLEATGVMSPALAVQIQGVDAEHTARMKAIIAEHGWPGTRLVRRDGAEAAWLLV